MNNETPLEKTINSTVLDVLEQMKNLDPDDRFQLFCEMGDWLFLAPEEDEILIVPSKYPD
jgi:hypothetical protein